VSTASRLQKALAIVESVDELPSLIHPDDDGKNGNNVPPAATNGDGHQLTFGNSMADPEDSILRQGWKKPFFFKPAQWVFLVFCFFLVFLVFFWVFFTQKREFLGFFSFNKTFRCIQTLKIMITLTN
jgi:hypothetical protein